MNELWLILASHDSVYNPGASSSSTLSPHTNTGMENVQQDVQYHQGDESGVHVLMCGQTRLEI